MALSIHILKGNPVLPLPLPKVVKTDSTNSPPDLKQYKSRVYVESEQKTFVYQVIIKVQSTGVKLGFQEAMVELQISFYHHTFFKTYKSFCFLCYQNCLSYSIGELITKCSNSYLLLMWCKMHLSLVTGWSSATLCSEMKVLMKHHLIKTNSGSCIKVLYIMPPPLQILELSQPQTSLMWVTENSILTWSHSILMNPPLKRDWGVCTVWSDADTIHTCQEGSD